MQRAPTFDELLAELPELAELENRVRAVRDPGGDLFCANNAWFSFARRLRELLGVWRRPSAGEDAARAALLGQAEAFEAAFERLYPLLPPCRDCGCALFEPSRAEDLEARRPRELAGRESRRDA